MNKYLVSGFQSITTDKVIEIRSKGLMIAIQLNQECTELLNAALQKKLLININRVKHTECGFANQWVAAKSRAMCPRCK
jgi:acetylornithine/succinyldiaminopimelate/putrescine aminotransferase